MPVAAAQRDDGRQGPGGAADDDVLRRPALQPHRVDDDIEEDREGEERGGQRSWRRGRAPATEPPARTRPNVRASSGRIATRRDRPAAGARHHRVDVGVVPHVEGAGRARPDRDGEERGEGDEGMDVARRHGEPDERGEHDERHHPRLQERDIVADRGVAEAGDGLAVAVDPQSDVAQERGSFDDGRSGPSVVPRGLARPLLDARQGLELVEGRRRGQRPFERRRAFAPRIGRRPLLAHEDRVVVRSKGRK